jgi:hypothetical protein
VVEEAGVPERSTDHGETTDKLYHLRLRVDCSLFVIYKADIVEILLEVVLKHQKSIKSS